MRFTIWISCVERTAVDFFERRDKIRTECRTSNELPRRESRGIRSHALSGARYGEPRWFLIVARKFFLLRRKTNCYLNFLTRFSFVLVRDTAVWQRSSVAVIGALFARCFTDRQHSAVLDPTRDSPQNSGTETKVTLICDKFHYFTLVCLNFFKYIFEQSKEKNRMINNRSCR